MHGLSLGISLGRWKSINNCITLHVVEYYIQLGQSTTAVEFPSFGKQV